MQYIAQWRMRFPQATFCIRWLLEIFGDIEGDILASGVGI